MLYIFAWFIYIELQICIVKKYNNNNCNGKKENHLHSATKITFLNLENEFWKKTFKFGLT